jgi:hypothetical protein
VQSAKQAKTWSTVALVVGLIGAVLYVLIMAIAGAASSGY